MGLKLPATLIMVIMVGASVVVLRLGSGLGGLESGKSEEFSSLWKNHLEQRLAATDRPENLFTGYYWLVSPELNAWEINEEGKAIVCASASRTAKAHPILREAEIRFTAERAWLKDDFGEFFFRRRDIVSDPRLTDTWQEIALGVRKPAPRYDCLWEAVREAASVQDHPHLVDIIVNDMKEKGLVANPNKMTPEDILWVMVEWSLPWWD